MSLFGFVACAPFRNATRQTHQVVCHGKIVTTEFGACRPQDQTRSNHTQHDGRQKQNQQSTNAARPPIPSNRGWNGRLSGSVLAAAVMAPAAVAAAAFTAAGMAAAITGTTTITTTTTTVKTTKTRTERPPGNGRSVRVQGNGQRKPIRVSSQRPATSRVGLAMTFANGQVSEAERGKRTNSSGQKNFVIGRIDGILARLVLIFDGGSRDEQKVSWNADNCPGESHTRTVYL